MSNKEPVYIAGVYEHPTREAPSKSTIQLHAEVAKGALNDAGIGKNDVNGYLTTNIPEYEAACEAMIMAEYLGFNDLSFADTTDWGGASYVSHIAHAATAIRQGKCEIALITQAGRPRSRSSNTGTSVGIPITMQDSFEKIYGVTPLSAFGMAARRHMHDYGTTSEQLAEIRVAAAHNAQYNPNAMYRNPIRIEDVLNSRMIADPLHLLDCCVISDGGGAAVVISADVKKAIDRRCVKVLGNGEATKHQNAGRVDVTYTAAQKSSQRAYEEAGIGPQDIDYAAIFDSTTITVLQAIEDLGFCEKGEGGSFVEGGTLKAPHGELPCNSDGGGLSSNQPGNRRGMILIIDAVNQLRGEANPEVQVTDPETAIVHGVGGNYAIRHSGITLILGDEDQ
jgi:acetyl-CoA C-acetyltransferase